jgi:hypothetical protein
MKFIKATRYPRYPGGTESAKDGDSGEQVNIKVYVRISERRESLAAGSGTES